jgi:hypothetical protein
MAGYEMDEKACVGGNSVKGLMAPDEASGSRRCGIFGRARKVEMRRMERGGCRSKGQRAKGAR